MLSILLSRYLTIFLWNRIIPASSPWMTLEIRFAESHPPLNNPCFFNAWMVYSEQVGVYLQAGPIKGEITHW